MSNNVQYVIKMYQALPLNSDYISVAQEKKNKSLDPHGYVLGCVVLERLVSSEALVGHKFAQKPDIQVSNLEIYAR